MSRNPDELNSDTVLQAVEDMLKGKVAESPDTDLIPANLEYPVAFKIRDYFRNKGFILADESGRRIDAKEETAAYGLLLEQSLKPTKLPWIQLYRKLFRPPARWVGVAHFSEQDDEDWLIRIFGKQNILPISEMAAEMRTEFREFDKDIKYRFSSEVEKRESRLLKIGYFNIRY